MSVPSKANIGAQGHDGAIAIVGAALRFPGAFDPASFHELTSTGRRMFREFGSGRAGTANDPTALRAALLDDELLPVKPAAGVFSNEITARHRLAAATATAALADVPGDGPDGRIGVFIADAPSPGTQRVSDWVRRSLGLTGDGLGLAEYRGHASGLRGSAARVLGAIRLHGGAARVVATPGGTHCSLRAVAAACTALRSGVYDVALAGGVTTGVDPSWLHRSAAAGWLAIHDVRVYDTYPTGTLPGEGCGVVVLRRAADARAAGLPAYAEIAGWHAADGGTGQYAALGPAYRSAGVNPADIQLIEGHGAATAAADLAELSVLSEVLGPYRERRRHRCALGSVSANIGDTRSAAGIAALLKAALAMTAETIPPATGCVRPNRLLRTAAAPFRLPATAEPWPTGSVQLAAVNSLGVASHPGAPRSGPVHMVLRRERDHPHPAGRRRRAISLATTQQGAPVLQRPPWDAS